MAHLLLALLSLTLAHGLAPEVTYGIWTATGVALNRVTVEGIALVIAGVLPVELGAAHRGRAVEPTVPDRL